MLVICGQDVANTTRKLYATCGLDALPTEFGQLTQLTWLDLKENSLAALPTEFGQLTQLTWLDLYQNSLAALPTEFGQLTQLISLRVEENSLVALPTEFGQLTQLATLHLQENSLAVLPTEFGQLTELTWPQVQKNSLAALPTEFGQLTQLTTLDVYQNSLAALPTEFGQLTQLGSLHLFENSLAALPTEFGQLTQLTRLDVYQNSLASLPTEFGQLTELATLDLDQNSLVALPTEFGQLTELRSPLRVDLNSLAALPTEFGQLTQLISLRVEENSLVALPTEFGQLTQLTWLQVEENSLAALPTEFGQLTELATLHLQKNSLAALPTEFGQLTQLTLLQVQKNSLAALPTEFGQLTQLTTLDVYQNSLAALPTEFGQLTQLGSLHLFENSLAALPTEFGQLTQLPSLDLQENSLAALPTEFGQLTELDTLHLQKNSLAALPTEFGQLTQLRWLDLDGQIQVPIPPTNVTPTIVRSASVDITWSPSAVRLTTIEYQARVTLQGITQTYHSPHGQMGINLLQHFADSGASQQRFTIRVKAKFHGGYSSTWSKPLNVTTCPASMEREDTNDVEACYALAGFYRNGSGLARSCTDLERDLPPGALGQCLKARLGIEDLPIQKNFWRASLSSEDVRLCPAVQFCKQRLSNVSFTSPDRYCTPYHAGTYCSDCVEDYVLGAEGCTFCTEEARESTGQIVRLVCTLLLLFFLLYVYVLYSAGCFKTKILCCRHGTRRHNSRRMSRWKEGCKELSGKVLIWTKVRILFGYFQVLSSYRRTFLKQSLTQSGDLLGVMALLSNVDVTWLVGNAAFRCLYDYSHYDLLLAATLGPMALALLLFVCTIGTAHCIIPRLLKAVRDHTESALLLMLFLIYPYVSQTVLGTFWCESFPDADRRFNLTTSALRADYRLSCEHDMDPKRLGFEIYAGVMVFVYPVGVVALYSWVLYVHKDRVMAFGNNITTNEKKDKLTKVSFLIKPYKVKRFWFEAYELVRKLVQTSLVGFLAGLPVELPGYLASISLSLTVVFVVLLMLLQPYKHRSDFAFAVMSLLLLLPASLYSLLDPYARHEGISNAGLEALVITELCVFALFVVFEIACAVGVGCVKKGSSCADCCLSGEGGGGGVETLDLDDSGDDGVGDEQDGDVIPLIAKKEIAELKASLEWSKAEIGPLRDENVSLIQPTDDTNDTSIQAI